MSITPNSNGHWSTIAPYVAPPIAASVAIIPAFRDMIAKSALQKGETNPSVPFRLGLKEGMKASPTVGAIVGSQMVIQRIVENALFGESNKRSVASVVESSAIVGLLSAPFLAVFNGKTMGKTVAESLGQLSVKQGGAIGAQEAAFVGGIALAEPVAAAMKEQFGDNRAVEYTAAFGSGAVASAAGHPANTALTRWQSDMPMGFRQSFWGVWTKARAVGLFSVIYKIGKDFLSPPASK